MEASQTPARKCIAILGCTGSIGTQALDVCRQHADKLEVVALSAHRSARKLVDAAREFGVARVALTDEACRHDPALADLPAGVEASFGPQAAVDIALADDVDCVLVSIVGAAGLAASAAVLKSGKQLALANKESLVVGGDLLMPLARPGQLLPVDSEHAAIFQCYLGERADQAYAIWLTCSGRPVFRAQPQRACARYQRRSARSPHVDMGAEDHHRFGDAHEQGPREDRGASSLRRRYGLYPCRHPAAV